MTDEQRQCTHDGCTSTNMDAKFRRALAEVADAADHAWREARHTDALSDDTRAALVAQLCALLAADAGLWEDVAAGVARASEGVA